MKPFFTTVGLCLAIGFTGPARADLYSSNPLKTDFTGSTCSSCSDKTYQVFTEQTGWQRFGTSTNNPLPTFLTGIDPNFFTKYQVDSLNVSIEQKWGSSTTTHWNLYVGDGTHTGGPYETFSLTGLGPITETFTINAGPVLTRALLPGNAGSLMFKLIEDTPGNTDTLWLFNAAVVVNYSDIPPVSSVPEPSAWLLLASVSGSLAAAVARKRKNAEIRR